MMAVMPLRGGRRHIRMGIERHYNGHELAELLGVDYETVLHMAQTGEIESVRVGRLRRFPESAVLDYLDRQRDRNVIPLRPRDTSPPRRKEAR